jgi:enoyl-CoA hydratase
MQRDIVFTRTGGLGVVVLNRPQSLNALTHAMCVELDDRLKDWESDPGVRAVAIKGAGERAFCAGGDIRRLYEEGLSGGDYPYQFYHDEYRLNARVHHFEKPYIAFMDGIVMGGGVGVSVHGRHRVATEFTSFAMPETGIGLFPDVGGSYFLARCPGEIGMYLALTGARLKAADAIYAGIADVLVPRARLAELERALAAIPRATAADVAAAIRRFAADPGPAPLAAHRADIDRLFAGDSIEEIVSALDNDGGAWAAATAAAIRGKSPTSLKIACRQMREGRRLDFDACMRMEWRIVNRVIRGRDFYEGTRAAVIDKDQKPRWNPPQLAAVTAADVAAYFAPLPGDELALN